MSGLPWFKLAGDFFAHPKTLELQAELDCAFADVYVVRLWAYVSRVAPSGRLTGRNPGAVLERAVGWHGLPGDLMASLLAVGFLQQDGDALVVHDWAEWQGAHVAKVEKDRSRPNARARKSHLSADPARGLVGASSGPRENPGVEIEREIETEKKKETALDGSRGDPPKAAESLTLVHVEPTKKRPGRTNALGEFIDWARAETRKQLSPDAPDNCRMEAHQAARLGEAVKDHGVATLKAAFGLWMGWEGSRTAGYPLGMFAAKWEGWVGRVKAPGAVTAAAVGRNDAPPAWDGAPPPDAAAAVPWRAALECWAERRMDYALDWLARIVPVGLADGTLSLWVPDKYAREWVEHHYGQLLADTLDMPYRFVLGKQEAA